DYYCAAWDNSVSSPLL
nr:immunoglobulin light chain junction region [Macaca mulatta]MOV94376.1 immunoglobulin light chain junction region [Macaca mulatta]MOV94510.1 immunoglobulin light chain junction region [Macaca mulatta]MOV94772.1 immunoglobulin light chain junction region [Macaca mulatta]MOV95001.1 immunoglobulin light chain junction region [Macaca mulatta]